MTKACSRRAFLGWLGAGVAAACTDRREAGSPPPATEPRGPTVTAPDPPPVDLAGDPFTLGVASGDPDSSSVVLWTRLASAAGMPDGDVVLAWEVAHDAGFAELAAAGLATAAAASAHSVHVEADGLRPDRWYHYRFRAGSFTSPAGRTRTTPASGAPAERLRLAVASCQDYQDGFYTPYPHLVADQPDLVVFVGDYIYESGREGPVRDHGSDEPIDLAGYRDRYALYRRDPDLQAAHAACPWVVMWDDHEVDNNYAGATSEAGAPPGEFLARRAAAYQAWREHLPVRLPPPDGADLPIHRRIAFGDLASILVLDTRQHRVDQACGEGLTSGCAELDAPDRTMLGAEQEAWLAGPDGLAGPPATWTVLAQQVVMADIEVFGVVNADAWDGYPAARRSLLGAVRSSGVRNPVVLTGDIHAGLVADLRLDGETVATELVATSISSRFPPELSGPFDALTAVVADVSYADSRRRGYLRCTVTREEWRAEHRVVETTQEPTSTVSTAASFVIRAGTPGARPA